LRQRHGGFGLSTDGHLPYSTNTAHFENYVAGFTAGFLTDGSQYVFISNCDFKRVTGYHRSEFGNWQDVLDLQQYMIDDAQAYFAQTDIWRGFIDHVYVRDNRFYDFDISNGMGISLYRVNWGYVGWNIIDPRVSGGVGLSMSNTINSWIYANIFRNLSTAIIQSGSPGYQSTYGSCYNGIGHWCDGYGCASGGQAANAYVNVSANRAVCFNPNYCSDPAFVPNPAIIPPPDTCRSAD
jgi:hypothetical protein